MPSYGGVFHQFQDAAYRGVLEGLGGAYDEFGRQVHAAGDDLVAWARRAGHRLAGERRRVNLAFAGQHRAVKRDALAGHDDELVIGGELEGIHLLQLALLLTFAYSGAISIMSAMDWRDLSTA